MGCVVSKPISSENIGCEIKCVNKSQMKRTQKDMDKDIVLSSSPSFRNNLIYN